MLLDKNGMFSDGQALTATAVSTNSLDLHDDVGHGNIMSLFVGVSTAFTGGTSVQVSLQDSDDDSSFSDVVSTGAIPVASLVAGYRFNLDVIPAQTRRYVRLNYTVSGTPSAGKVTAGITPTNQQSYTDAQKLGGNNTI